jgi:flagellar hook assembly protein FlgD
VKLEVFDVAGRTVAVPVDEVQTAGVHAAVWNGRDSGGRDVAVGIYFYRVTFGGQELTRKMMLMK